MKEQDKQAERAFFNRGMEAVISEHPSDEAYINECFQILEFPAQMSGALVLECGCGLGDWGKALARRGAQVIGVDIAEEVIEANKRINAAVPNYTCKTGDLEDKKLFDEHSLDKITCFGVLHHFPSINQVIENFAYWLKEDGVVYVVEPNGGNPANKVGKLVRKLLPAKLVAEKGLASVNEMHDWSMSEYEQHFEACGFACSMKMSISRPTNAMPKGWSLAGLIHKVRWCFYCFARFFSSPINKGNPLIFKMGLKKVATNE